MQPMKKDAAYWKARAEFAEQQYKSFVKTEEEERLELCMTLVRDLKLHLQPSNDTLKLFRENFSVLEGTVKTATDTSANTSKLYKLVIILLVVNIIFQLASFGNS